jgi:hypothetical protein
VPWQYAPDDPNRIRWLPEAKQVWQAIINDKPLAPKFLNDAITAEHLPGSPTASPTGSPTGSPSGTPSGTPSSPTTSEPTTSPSTQSSAEAAEQARENGLCA